MSSHCDCDLEDCNLFLNIFLHYTPAYGDASWQQVWLQKVQHCDRDPVHSNPILSQDI